MKAEEELAELGVRQYIRNHVIAFMQKKAGSKITPEEFMDELNVVILKDLVKIASDEFSEVISEVYELYEKKK